MDDKVYSITLADGTEIAGLKLNGNNFVSLVEVSADTFEDNTYPVIISDGETAEEHPYMTLVQVTQMGEEWWFILRDLSQEELRDAKVRADIDYIALMTDVDIDF